MIGVFDIFKIGIGPSSSHTVGPMDAARRFTERLKNENLLANLARLQVLLYGSLAYTGHGHGTDKAVLLGLCGETPAEVDLETIPSRLEEIATHKTLKLLGEFPIKFNPETDLVFDKQTPSPGHPNGMRFIAYNAQDAEILNEVYFSIGGGFIMNEAHYADMVYRKTHKIPVGEVPEPHPYRSARQLLDMAEAAKKTIAELALLNECAYRSQAEVETGLDKVWDVMNASINRGLSHNGILPGALKVKRRARQLFETAKARMADVFKNSAMPHHFMDLVSSYAMAVNEENAAGGRVVTSPTNGAAGIIPAVIRYYTEMCPGADRAGIHTFLLTAAAFGGVIKRNASISGAEGGCQAEVGSASAMAAAGLCAALGGTNAQIENAGEIALEHHLGMTCDPIGGLVQIPCIERNTMGAIKAINATSLALAGDGKHFVFFDNVVETMRQTGDDMKSQYKETSQGGLAVNVVEC